MTPLPWRALCRRPGGQFFVVLGATCDAILRVVCVLWQAGAIDDLTSLQWRNDFAQWVEMAA